MNWFSAQRFGFIHSPKGWWGRGSRYGRFGGQRFAGGDDGSAVGVGELGSEGKDGSYFKNLFQELEKFRNHLRKKLSKKDVYGESLQEVIGVCTEKWLASLPHSEGSIFSLHSSQTNYVSPKHW
ncbi:Protein PLASTID REDOX INSENSITIVE 2 [Quillaja saponaria]|uniref:Protein PLASTID REDOX INSENSITIVE 2 n=1 Tax=Quillaja saponaria TaxID=32244 RepID=A0AAD7M1G7_QUISA|nr:Protein PLASTID REDOX INSENSITIVE 2 [Quillaja saponaria]